MAFNQFPYTNFHELNADWILNKMKESLAAMEEALESVSSYESRLQQAEQDIDALEDSRVSYAAEQQLNSGQQLMARGNIGAAPAIGVVYYNQDQALSEEYKARARANIGAADAAVMPDVSDVVRTSPQTLTGDQKLQARENIDAAEKTLPGAVKYSAAQSLTDAQKLQARENIGAQVAGSYVQYTAQELTASEQTRARANIDAGEAPVIFAVAPDELETGYYCTMSRSDILTAIDEGKIPIMLFTPIGSTDIYVAQVESSSTSIVGYVFQPMSPNSLVNSSVWSIAITDNAGSDLITVNFMEYRWLPASTMADSGKVPIVNAQGVALWDNLVTVNTVSGTTPTIAPADKNVYNCGELTSLTLSSPPATGAYSIVFTSGSTPTTITGASGILGLESFTPAASTIYEINVLDNRAVVGIWEVSP